jgi:hypothetical protein
VCLIKHSEFRHFLSRRTTLPPLGDLFTPPRRRHRGPGIPSDDRRAARHLREPPLHCTRLVVVNELPVTRDTLLVRLLGAGSVLKLAIAELQTLPEDAPERRLALPVLLRLRLTVPTDPAQQTSDDQEFLMNTQDIVETWRREAIQEGVKQGLEQGVKQGLEQGERKVLLRQLRRRFGAEVDGKIERRVAAAPAEQIEIWVERVLSAATLNELLAD